MTVASPILSVRALQGAPSEMRLGASDWGTPGRVLSGRFAVFNKWTTIRSAYEGHFIEQVGPGAFDRTLVEHAERIRILYEHGQDPTLGNKPLGPWRSWRDAEGQAYEVDLIETDYNDRFIIPAAEKRLLGASFRFAVPNDDAEAWDTPMRSTSWNPDRLKERTLLDLDLFEMGPVTWGAYPDAGQGLRSATDEYHDRLLNDPLFLARFTERVGLRVVERILSASAADGADGEDITTSEATAGGQTSEPATRIAESLARFRTHA